MAGGLDSEACFQGRRAAASGGGSSGGGGTGRRKQLLFGEQSSGCQRGPLPLPLASDSLAKAARPHKEAGLLPSAKMMEVGANSPQGLGPSCHRGVGLRSTTRTNQATREWRNSLA